MGSMIPHDCACYDCNVSERRGHSLTFTLAVLVLLGFALALATAGCAPRTVKLDARWAPLVEVVEAPGAGDGVFWTVAPYVFTNDVAYFSSMEPVQQEGLLTHERVHAVRQQTYVGPVLWGTAGWLERYGTDGTFELAEELLAWREQILYLRARGAEVDPDYVGNFIATQYVTLGGAPLMSYEDAWHWVVDIIEGR